MDHTHCRELYTRPQTGGLIIDLVVVEQRQPRWSHLVHISPLLSTFDDYIGIQFREGYVNVNGVSEGHDKRWETVAGLRPKLEHSRDSMRYSSRVEGDTFISSQSRRHLPFHVDRGLRGA